MRGLTLWGFVVGWVGALVVLLAVILMTFGFRAKSRRYPNSGALRSSGWENYLRNLKRVNIILLAGVACQFISIFPFALAAFDF